MIVTKWFTGKLDETDYYPIPREGHYSITFYIPDLTKCSADNFTKKVEEINCNYIDGGIELRNYNLVSIDYRTTEVKIEFDCVAFYGGSPVITEVNILLSIDVVSYQVNGQDAFKYFEQYHSGPQAIPEDYFTGVLHDPGQGYVKDYAPGAKTIVATGFKIVDPKSAQTSIIGYDRRTVVKAGPDHRLFSVYQDDKEFFNKPAGYDDYAEYYIWYSYQDNCVKVRRGEDKEWSLENTTDLKRLGIVIVGHGGDANFEYFEHSITYPTSGGGGGGIAWAVLHLVYTTSSRGFITKYHYPIFKINIRVTRYSKTKDVFPVRSEYEDTKIIVEKEYVRLGNSSICAIQDAKPRGTILCASSGKNGTIDKGDSSDAGFITKPGAGGSVTYDTNKKFTNYITYVKGENGGDGGGWGWTPNYQGTTIDAGSWSSTDVSSNNFCLKFLQDEQYQIHIEHDWHSMVGPYSEKSWFVIPGGHSYGEGAYAHVAEEWDPEEFTAIEFHSAGIGGGGAAFRHIQFWDDNSDSSTKVAAINACRGGPAYFALYH